MTSPRRALQQQPGASIYLAVPCGAEYNAGQEDTGNAERAEDTETAEQAETTENEGRDKIIAFPPFLSVSSVLSVVQSSRLCALYVRCVETVPLCDTSVTDS